MSSVFNRGTKARPRWYLKVKDAKGCWKMLASHQPTKKAAEQMANDLEAQARRQSLGLEKPPAPPSPLCGSLLERWISGDVVKDGQARAWKGISNRSARGDGLRVRRHLVPRFADVPLSELTPQFLMRWLDEMDAAEELASATQRVHLNLMSRFLGWCVVQGLIVTNPVRSIPSSERPRQTPKDPNAPWLQTDAIVVALMRTLPEPYNLAFWIANRSGLRPGEVCGLRLSDLASLSQGCIRVRFSYAQSLKEDRGEGKAKWAPAADDAEAVLGPWLARRRGEGAGEEDHLFVHTSGRPLVYDDLLAAWKPARESLGLDITFNQAGRHSFVSRNLDKGVPIDQVAEAVGHSSPLVTQRNYNHVIRKTFSASLRAGLSKPGADA